VSQKSHKATMFYQINPTYTNRVSKCSEQLFQMLDSIKI